MLVTGIIVWQVVDWSDEPEDNIAPTDSEVGVYQHAAVATDAPYCSDIGVYGNPILIHYKSAILCMCRKRTSLLIIFKFI